MLGKGEKRLVAAYSAAHFAVDLCCAMLVLPAARAASDKAMALLIYNFCAFAMQLPIGVLADRYGGGRYFSAAGCLMVALGGLLPSPMLTAVVCGLGNAAFHIGGGADVMAVTEGAKYLGIYVSPGAMGIFLGALASRAGRSFAAFAACLMLACAVAIMTCCKDGAGPGSPELPRGREQWLRLMSLLAVVTLRSYGGVIMSFPWRAGAWAWIAALCVVGGKCIGGFASDRFGEVRSATVTLSAAAIALIFSAFPLPGALGLLLFNMSMPVTLYAARDILREGRATAFGLLTLGLFLGMLPAMGLSLLLTELIELSAALLLKKREDIGLIALANLMTNPAVVYLSLLTKALRPGLYPAAAAVTELLAVLAEGYAYKRRAAQIARPMLFSLCMNALSFGTGLVIKLIF